MDDLEGHDIEIPSFSLFIELGFKMGAKQVTTLNHEHGFTKWWAEGFKIQVI